MAVLRIVPNLKVTSTESARADYGALFGLDTVMDHGWIATLAAADRPHAQLSVLTHDETAPVLPVLSIQVDDLDDVHARAVAAGWPIVHPITVEAWGVRRFFVRDPDGNVVNVLEHA